MQFCRKDLANSSVYSTLWSQQSTKGNKMDIQGLQFGFVGGFDLFCLVWIYVFCLFALVFNYYFILFFTYKQLGSNLTLNPTQSYQSCQNDFQTLFVKLPSILYSDVLVIVNQFDKYVIWFLQTAVITRICTLVLNWCPGCSCDVAVAQHMINSHSDNDEYDDTLEMDLTRSVDIMGKEHREIQLLHSHPLYFFSSSTQHGLHPSRGRSCSWCSGCTVSFVHIADCFILKKYSRGLKTEQPILTLQQTQPEVILVK